MFGPVDQVDTPVPPEGPAGDPPFELGGLDRCRVAVRTLLSRAKFLLRRVLSPEWYLFSGAHLVDVEPHDGFRLWCKFNDGLEGVIDLSDLAADPYCRKWKTEPGFFESVVIAGGALQWDEYIDVCYDAVRARLLGLPKETELDEIWGDVPPRVPRSPDLVFAKAMEVLRVWCVFADGTKGVADFSDWSMNGKFERWRTEPGFFESVKVKGWCLHWDDWVDIWSECVYERVDGGRRAGNPRQLPRALDA